ncbi:M48 family metallopeptidase [Pseudomarimonas arenosa]|uniref:M48 family metallopeptidase n=1 Tax=Pseudomarimonas arenosa TaxID=2774145 RepID=A0AAW3ZQ05_9GAMM|nr:M48 family metallopeptidase [Pseudomarimonas arenosa]MBD8527244.1 M48 family metallopeptidase [Pseudomarimonas arenosa]
MTRVRRFALALGVLMLPGLFGLFAAKVGEGRYTALVQKFQANQGDEVAAVSAAEFCRGPMPSPPLGWQEEGDETPPAEVLVASDCRILLGLPALRWIAVFSMLAGGGLLLALWWAASTVRRDRNRLLTIFLPGLRVAVYGAIAMLLLSGYLIAFGGLAAIPGELANLAVVIGILCVLAALFATFKLRGALHPDVSFYHAAYASPTAHPMLWELIERLAERLGTAKPDTLLLGIEPTFFVTEARVQSHRERKPRAGRAMYLSLPLMRMLSVPELAAVIGHELGHFRGEDTRYSSQFYPVYAGAHRALEGWYEGEDYWLTWLATLPAVQLLELFVTEVEEVEAEISRERELLADRAGAEVASGMDLASALLKLGSAHMLLPEFEQDVWERYSKGNEWAPLGERLASISVRRLGEAARQDLELEFPHPTDSHPPMPERLASLGLGWAAVLDQLTMPTLEQSSVCLINDARRLECELFRQWLAQFDDEP